jgi:3-oxosteroid 1-dehydrogenase
MASAGKQDSAEEGLTYLETVTAGSTPKECLRAYVEEAPRMITYLEEHTQIRFESIVDYPDYYAEAPGGKPGGRSCEPTPLDGYRLGDEFFRIAMHPPAFHPLHFMTPMVRDGMPLIRAGLPGTKIVLRHLFRFLFDVRARWRGMRHTQLGLGCALIGRARLALMDRKIPLWLNTELRDLILSEGRVAGALISREGREIRIQARRGVLLATGGFERNAALRKRHQRAPIGTDWTAGMETNTGDAVAIGERIGASFDLMDESWWCPVFQLPAEDFVRLVVYEKNLAGGIIVNQRGERFMNEAAPYNDVVKSIYRAHSPDASCIPAYLIFDRRFRRAYPVGPLLPGRLQPDWALPKHYWSYLTKAATLEGLASQLEIDASGLQRTVTRFNAFARAGKDLDFGRGDLLQDSYYTARPTGPNPSLGEINKGPFYAVKVWPGDLGTKGGLRTDPQARVLDRADQPILGLYATGNCTSATMGRSYPGAGGTIGPAMTFGFIAAEQSMKNS